jgi:RHS repeat-associated protein
VFWQVRVDSYLYNGMEIQDELGINIYDTEYRNLDPAIARWWQIDPKASERESPYVSMANNPIIYNDFLGDTTYYFDMYGNQLGLINDDLENQVHFIDKEKYQSLTDFFNSLPTESEDGEDLTKKVELLKTLALREGSEAFIGSSTYQQLENVFNQSISESLNGQPYEYFNREHGGFLASQEGTKELMYIDHPEGRYKSDMGRNKFDMYKAMQNRKGNEFADAHTHQAESNEYVTFHTGITSPGDKVMNPNQPGVIINKKDILIYSKTRRQNGVRTNSKTVKISRSFFR